MSRLRNLLAKASFSKTSKVAIGMKDASTPDAVLAVNTLKTKAYKEIPELKAEVDAIIANSKVNEAAKPVEKEAAPKSTTRAGEPRRGW